MEEPMILSLRRATVPLAAFLALALARAADAQFSWQTATPESQGLSTPKLDAMRNNLINRGTTHLLVIRNDKIVYEWYASGQSRTTKHYTASMAKALVGGVSLGIALDDGLISLDDLATRFVPQWVGVARKSQIKVRHLGSHTSGIEDADQGDPGWESEFWQRNPPPNDPFTISRDRAPCLETPGTLERYSNPGIAMLTYCVTAGLRNAPVKDIRTLLRDRVMRPIGVPDAEWSCGYGQTFTVDGLPLVGSWGGGSYSPNATARVARLMLKRGTWEGAELMNAAAVQAITSDAGTPGNGGQGWWTDSDGSGGDLPPDAFWGAGAGHQLVVVIPSLNMIAVRNGGTLDSALDFDAAARQHFFNPLMAAVTTQSTGGPYPPSPVITGLSWASASSIVRKAPGCDTWPLTWADDDYLYGTYGDGNGFEPQLSVKLSLGFAKIAGSATSFTGTNFRSATGEQRGDGASGKKASGILMVNGVLYMWVRNADNNGNQSQLAWSSDHGATWTWSSWKFAEFGYPTFINFGKNYAGARDTYVYAVTHDNPSAYNEANRFILMRVPKDRIRDRAAYQFFKARDAAGNVTWTSDITQRGAVFTHNGRCRRSGISYNAGLRRYLWWQMYHVDGQDNRFAGGFGVYDAPEPWGPWTTVYFTTSWDVGPGETGHFPPKWMSADGKTVYLVFSGDDKFSVRKATLTTASTGFNVRIDSVSSGKAYSTATARAGALYYIDRSYTISSLGAALANGVLLRTANDDKNVTASNHLTFTVSANATVYVGYDKRATRLPTWLQSGWTATSDVLSLTDASASPMRVYRKSVAAGSVTLGGNQQGGPTGAGSHYVVIVQPAASLTASAEAAVPAGPLAEDVWENPGDTDGDGLQDAFEAASFTDPNRSDTDGDGTPDEEELDGTGRTLWEAQQGGGMPSTAPDDGGDSGSCGATGLEVGAVLLLGLLRRLRRAAVLAGAGLAVLALAIPAAAQTTGSPYPTSSTITGVSFTWSTHDRRAPGSDNWPVTWADDGHQYASWGDGGGFGGTNSDGRVSLGFARVEGSATSYTGYNVWGGKNPENPAQFDGKCYGIISIGGVLYMWRGPGSDTTSYNEARLYRSTDRAAHWTGAGWAYVKSDGIVMPTILNYGRDYAGARDTYVYHYFIKLQGSPTSLNVHKPGVVYLVRVPKDQLFTKASYEWFAGMSGGQPTWSTTFASKQPVFQDPNGVGWNLSVSYNAGLRRYLLCTEHTATSAGNFGMFDAPEPWGPWTTVLYAGAWGSGHIETSTFFWNFSNKWLSADGKSFTLVFTGIRSNDSWNTVRGTFTTPSSAVPPSAPTNLAAAAASSSQINLTWTDASSNETGFKIERKTGSGGTYSQIATVGAGVTSYASTGLAAGTTYVYRVRAYNAAGNSAYSNEASATTPSGGFSVRIDFVSTGKPYSTATARAGALYYVDRSYTIGTIGAALNNGVLLRTANDDKYVTASPHLKFTVSAGATVYVAYDKRATRAPSWLQSGWTITSDVLTVTDASASPLRLYRRSYSAGQVSLGGNHAGGDTGARSNYVVIVQPSASMTPSHAASIPEDVWDHPGDSDGDGLSDTFEAAHFTDPALADTDGDGEPDESELDGLGRTLWDVQESGAATAPGDGGSSGSCGALGLELCIALGLSRLLRLRQPRRRRGRGRLP
jgi:hypothetical protein